MKHLFYIISSLAFVFSTITLSPGASQAQAMDTALARKYFVEAASICRNDQGRLWGKTLCGPMLFVDAETREAVANQVDKDGRLAKRGEVFVGRLPEAVGVANTATEWAGVRWIMMLWPLPSNRYARARLMMHEMFHRFQAEAGCALRNPSNSHLDSMRGRVLLQLEWLALREAVTHAGAQRRQAVRDALIFRARRRQLFPQAATEERDLELNEGLAEYTGVMLSGRTRAELPGYIAAQLDQSASNHSFMRSFAYGSGPAYGFLLDEAKWSWRKDPAAELDFGALLEKAYFVRLPENTEGEARARAGVYGGDELLAAETLREAAREKTIARFRAKLVDGPVLVIPLTGSVNYTFNPYNLLPLDEKGTLYPTMRVSDEWGILTVTDGALLTREHGKAARVFVSAPADTKGRPFKGDGWTLELNEGWKIEAGTRPGDFTLKKE